MADETPEPACDHIPMLFAVPDFDKDEVIITVGPIAIEDFGSLTEILSSEELHHTVRESIRFAREQCEAAERAEKAKLN